MNLEAAPVLTVAAELRAGGAEALGGIDDDALEAAFLGAVEAFRDPASAERRRLDPGLRATTALSQGCLDASLAALLDGFTTQEVRAVLARAGARTQRPRAVRAGAPPPAPHLIVLAAEPPGVLLQPLLASLALRRPVLVKSSSREPTFAPAFTAALASREPALGDAVAAVLWRGGEPEIEAPLYALAPSSAHALVDRVVAYGGGSALADLRRRAGEKLIAFGPKASVALVGGALDDGELRQVAAGLARDVALFEQRGCLSLQAIYTDGDASALQDALALALLDAARRWPPPALPTAAAAALRLAREEASFLGSRVAATPLEQATVILDSRALFLPAAGYRTVRIHPVAHLGAAIDILRPHGPRLQGAALAAAADDFDLRQELNGLGVSYLCSPGELQSPPASWPNGGVDLIDALG